MADDQFQATGNWWDSSSSRNVRFETPPPSQTSSSNLTTIPNFTWHHQHPDMDHDLKPTSSMSDTSTHPNLHMIMGLGLSSHPIDWNQPPHHNLLSNRGDQKVVSDGRFRSMFQENLSSGSNNFQQESGMGLSQVEWRDKLLFSTDSSSTTTTDQYSTSGDSIVTTSQGMACSFQMDSCANPSVLQGLLLGPEAANSSSSSSFDINNRSFNNFPYNNNDQLMASWPKVSQFLRTSPPKQTQPHGCGGGNSQLHFTNNAAFWNASDAHHHHAAIKESRPSLFPSLQPPFHTPNFDAQSKDICAGRETTSGVGKKSGSEAAPKRARNETSSTLPPFKVRKEKMGDRITALQQLVSPFGKTDTASVLSEAIEYIKFLHEQVSVLSTPYLKSGAPLQHQQNSGKSKEPEALKQDLRSRGLCLVPVSSTFPVTHETTVDFWMPTFGATFR